MSRKFVANALQKFKKIAHLNFQKYENTKKDSAQCYKNYSYKLVPGRRWRNKKVTKNVFYET